MLENRYKNHEIRIRINEIVKCEQGGRMLSPNVATLI